MQLEANVPNMIKCDNLYVFFNFTPANLGYVKRIDPLSVPAFHVFISSNTSHANNEALTELMLFCTDIRQRWRKPIKVTLYAPMRHTVLKRWVEDYYEPYRKLFEWVYVSNKFCSPMYRLNHQPFATEGDKLNEQLVVQYDLVHLGQQTMTVGYESLAGGYTKLASFNVEPAEPWLATGHPGYH